MTNSTWGHSFWIYVLPEDLKQIQSGLMQEKLYPFLYGYDVGLVGYKMTWAILDEAKEPTCLMYNWQPESSGVLKGLFLLRFSWSGPQDASHIIKFKEKYHIKWHLIGISPDWLGEPICLVYSRETKSRCLELVKTLGQQTA